LHAQTGKKIQKVHEQVPATAHGGIHVTERQASAHGGSGPIALGDAPIYLRRGETFPMPARSCKAEQTPTAQRGSADYLDATREFWQARTGRPLSREDAREMAHNLLGFFRVLREWTLAERARAEALFSSTVAEPPAVRRVRSRKKTLPTDEIPSSR
jgi:hypothetical protein